MADLSSGRSAVFYRRYFLNRILELRQQSEPGSAFCEKRAWDVSLFSVSVSQNCSRIGRASFLGLSFSELKSHRMCFFS